MNKKETEIRNKTRVLREKEGKKETLKRQDRAFTLTAGNIISCA
jgi:hypothetical protein